MTIAYNNSSKYSESINLNNCFDILLKDDVFYGRSDPDSDPCGYRAVLTLKLAEKFYNKPGLTQKFLKKDNNFIRPKEVDLLALLETNSLDYIFIYRSVAEQHRLNYLILPDEINLKNPAYTDHYSMVDVEITGKQPGDRITQKGEPMVYGITIPKNAPNKNAAIAFVEFVLDNNKGLKIMEKNGQPSVVPAETETYKNIPEQLRRFVRN
jgi:molybdate/tungstate transport system substrate-binding protein